MLNKQERSVKEHRVSTKSQVRFCSTLLYFNFLPYNPILVPQDSVCS